MRRKKETNINVFRLVLVWATISISIVVVAFSRGI
jgi:hypothetical protein